MFIFYCVFYSLVSDPALLLIAAMLCKLPEKTTLRTYMYILLLLLLIIITIIIIIIIFIIIIIIIFIIIIILFFE